MTASRRATTSPAPSTCAAARPRPTAHCATGRRELAAGRVPAHPVLAVPGMVAETAMALARRRHGNPAADHRRPRHAWTRVCSGCVTRGDCRRRAVAAGTRHHRPRRGAGRRRALAPVGDRQRRRLRARGPGGAGADPPAAARTPSARRSWRRCAGKRAHPAADVLVRSGVRRRQRAPLSRKRRRSRR